jgi:hypothetical protein
MKKGSTAVWHESFLARRRRPARRAIPTRLDAGRVSIQAGWYQISKFSHGFSLPHISHLYFNVLAGSRSSILTSSQPIFSQIFPSKDALLTAPATSDMGVNR